MGRIVRWVIGGGVALSSLYLLAFVNVDVPDRSKPSVCGAGPVRVLLLGPTRNLDLLGDGECRRIAGFIALFCIALGAVGVWMVIGWLPAAVRVRSDPKASVLLVPTWNRRGLALFAPMVGLALLLSLTVSVNYGLRLAALPLVPLQAWLTHRLISRLRVEVLADALVVRGTDRSVTVAFADIVRVTARRGLGVRLHRRADRPLILPFVVREGPYLRAVAARLQGLIGRPDDGQPAPPERVESVVPAYEYAAVYLTAAALVVLVLVGS